MKDSKTILLLLLSLGLMGTWVYHLYDKSHYTKHQVEVLVKDSMATREAIRDSLQKLFNEKSFELDTTKIHSDSLKGKLDSSVQRILSLRNQISSILKKNSIDKNDLKHAKDLIMEYKENIDKMKVENSDLETERQRLNGVLAQLNDEMKGLQQNIQKITQENKELTETINQASTFVASDIVLSAVATKSGNRDAETSTAKKAKKFVFSFTLQNNVVSNSYYDAYVLIIEPGNKVLQNDVWGADYFNSKNEGRKAYTTKIHFEYTRGDKKKILYTLDPANFLQGTYVLQVYQNGVMIGDAKKILN
jgi:myosin heavy subunit